MRWGTYLGGVGAGGRGGGSLLHGHLPAHRRHRVRGDRGGRSRAPARGVPRRARDGGAATTDRKSTRLNSSHLVISYAVFCLKKKKKNEHNNTNTYTHPNDKKHAAAHPTNTSK